MNAGQREEFDRTEKEHREENHDPGQGDGAGAGSLSVGDYQRLRQGYERALSPEAREKMGGTNPIGEVQTSRRVVRIRPETHIPATVEDDWQGDYRSEKVRSGGRIGPIGVFLILAVGLLGGLVLYAGGIDYVNGLFGEDEETQGEDLTLVTERPGADLTAIDPGPTPGEMIEEENLGEVIPEENLAAAEEERRREEEAAAQRKREEEDKRAAEERRAAEQQRAREAAAERERQRKARESAAAEQHTAVESTGEREARTVTDAPSPRSNASTASGSWTAQVGATPDRAEADRIASRLRSRGGSGVTVITAEKNGSPIYRVRFGTFSSEDEARQTSTRLGFTDAWIIKR